MALRYGSLNPGFAEKMGVKDQGTLDKLNDVHQKIDAIIKAMYALDPVNSHKDLAMLYAYRQQITELDYCLQELWGFERDITKHTWLPRCPWNMIP